MGETDRDIVWPAQALAYKLSELKITELRAVSTLDNFIVLDDGPLPLDLLEQRMTDWLADQRRNEKK